MPRSTSIVSSLVRSAPRPAVRAPTYIHGPTRRTVSTSTSAAPAGGAASSGSAASNGGSAAAEAGTALPSHWFHKHNYPLFALAVGISALCFQIKILYPWHKELSDQFESLTETANMVNEIAVDMKTKLARLTEIEQVIREDEIAIFAKQRIVLKQEGEVMDALKVIKKRVLGGHK